MKHFIDVETTGFDCWKNCVISLAWIITDDKNETVAEFYEECAPDSKKGWNVEAEKIHGFTYEEQIKKQSNLDMVNNLFTFLDTNNVRTNLWYHANASFDYKFLFGLITKAADNRIFDLWKYVLPNENVNTIKLFNQHLNRNEKGKLKPKKDRTSVALDKLCKYYGVGLEHHNALSDTRGLVSCVKAAGF